MCDFQFSKKFSLQSKHQYFSQYVSNEYVYQYEQFDNAEAIQNHLNETLYLFSFLQN